MTGCVAFWWPQLLTVEMPFDAIGAKQLSAMAGMLPQAHTCDNLLELPNYWAALCARAGVPVHSWRDGGGRVNALIAELRQTVGHASTPLCPTPLPSHPASQPSAGHHVTAA